MLVVVERVLTLCNGLTYMKYVFGTSFRYFTQTLVMYVVWMTHHFCLMVQHPHFEWCSKNLLKFSQTSAIQLPLC